MPDEDECGADRSRHAVLRGVGLHRVGAVRQAGDVQDGAGPIAVGVGGGRRGQFPGVLDAVGVGIDEHRHRAVGRSATAVEGRRVGVGDVVGAADAAVAAGLKVHGDRRLADPHADGAGRGGGPVADLDGEAVRAAVAGGRGVGDGAARRDVGRAGRGGRPADRQRAVAGRGRLAPGQRGAAEEIGGVKQSRHVGCPRVGGKVQRRRGARKAWRRLVDQHRDAVAAAVGDDEIGLAVAIDVTDRDRAGVQPDRVVGLGLEGAVAPAQQHRDAPGIEGVGRDEVDLAITVDVTDRNPVRVQPDRVVCLGLEAAVALAQQHRDAPRVGGIGRDEVELAVAVDVGGHDRVGIDAHRVFGFGLEGAVALAQQHRDGAAAAVAVARDEIEFAVAVEIADRDRAGVQPDRVVGLRLEGAVAPAQQHRDAPVVVGVGRDEVELAVAVEIAGGDPIRAGAGRIGDLRLERAVALAQHHADAVAAAARDQVKLAVAVEIADRQRASAGAPRDVGLGLEGAVAVAQQHRERGTVEVAREEIDLAIRVEIAHGHPPRTGAGRIAGRGLDGQRQEVRIAGDVQRHGVDPSAGDLQHPVAAGGGRPGRVGGGGHVGAGGGSEGADEGLPVRSGSDVAAVEEQVAAGPKRRTDGGQIVRAGGQRVPVKGGGAERQGSPAAMADDMDGVIAGMGSGPGRDLRQPVLVAVQNPHLDAGTDALHQRLVIGDPRLDEGDLAPVARGRRIGRTGDRRLGGLGGGRESGRLGNGLRQGVDHGVVGGIGPCLGRRNVGGVRGLRTRRDARGIEHEPRFKREDMARAVARPRRRFFRPANLRAPVAIAPSAKNLHGSSPKARCVRA